jgi:mRNA interferase MazF
VDLRRGDIHWVNLEPVLGSEANKVRPAVIVSNDAANRAASRSRQGVVTVVPLTSNITRVFPFQVLMPAEHTGLDGDAKAQAEQVRSVSAVRIGRRAGRVPAALLTRLDDALRLHLNLD